MSSVEPSSPQKTDSIQSDSVPEEESNPLPKEPPIIFAQLESKVYATAISPYGRRVVIGLDNGSLRLFDLTTGKPIGRPFKGHDDSVFSVAFAPDGQSIVSGSADKTIRLWDLEGNPICQPFRGHNDSVFSVAFAPDGQSIVSGGADNTVRRWDLEGNPICQPFRGHKDSVLSVAFAPDGQSIVSGGRDKTVRRWDLEGNPIAQPFKGHEAAVSSVAFAPDGQSIVSGSHDTTVWLWDLEGNLITYPFIGHEHSVLSVAFAPDGQSIVSGSYDNTVRLWDLEGNPIAQPFKGHEALVSSVAFAPDGQSIVSGSYDNTVRLWDLEGNLIGQPFRGHENSVWLVAFAPDSQSIVSGSDDKTLRLWDLEGNLICQPLKGHDGSVFSAAFAPHGQSIVSGSADTTMRLWDLKGNPIGQPFKGHENTVLSVAFAPNGQSIVSGSTDKTLRLWDLQGNPIGQPFRGHDDSVLSVAFAPNGQSIVSGSTDKTLRLWDLQGNPIGQPFRGHDDSIWLVAFAPNGQSIVSGSDDKTLRLWDLEGNPIAQPFKGHNDSVLSVAFAPDGQSIVSGSADTTMRLWDLKGNLIGQPFIGHESSVLSVAFAPDGQSIASGSSDHTVRLWVSPMVNLGQPIRNLGERVSQVVVPQSISNDAAKGNDYLNVKNEIDALAEVLMLRALEPPIAVGMLGSWGSGKSFGMHLIKNKINEIRSQRVSQLQAWGDPMNPNVAFPYVGHIYQIQFNAWTYAKSNLWASLMQEIFYELNRQISLEQQLGKILAKSGDSSSRNQLQDRWQDSSTRLIDRLIYRPFAWLKQFLINVLWQSTKYFTLKILQILDILAISLILWHIFIPIVLVLFRITFLSIDRLIKFSLFLVEFAKKHKNSSLDTVTKFIQERRLAERYNSMRLNLENWFKEQVSYYWLETEGRRYSQFEIVLERFFFFSGCVGLFRRWRARYQFWQQQLRQFSWYKKTGFVNSNFMTADELLKSNRISNALRRGGSFWRALYFLNEEERNTLLRNEIGAQKFDSWKTLASESEISNYLWDTLARLRQDEQKTLKETESELQKKESQLQCRLERAEVDVKKQLNHRRLAAFWNPVVHALASQHFSKEKIKELSAAGKTGRILRKTINSWRGLLSLFLLGGVLVFSFAPEGLPSLLEQLLIYLQRERLQNDLKFWATAITGTVISLIPVFKSLSDYVIAVRKEQAQIKSDLDTLLKQAKSQEDELAKEVDQLKLQVEEQQQRIGLTATHNSLVDFVAARLEQASYDQKLGLMQQVRRDLEDLSNRLTPGPYNIDKLKQIFPRGPARVILYIDDLDRCPPNRVVEVLEAVQLLLKTKLFIVVLAIDDRYIARALEQVYQGVLKRKGKPSGIDYLEKIIQIPYRMQPISPAKIEDYLRSQVIVTQPKPKTDDTPKSKVAPVKSSSVPSEENSQHQSSVITGADYAGDFHTISNAEPPAKLDTDQSDPIKPLTETFTDRLSNPAISSQRTGQTDEISLFQQSSDPNPKSESTKPKPSKISRSYLETVASVTKFDADEFQILVDCCKHVDITPRTAKRLINIYKILQIIWSKQEQQTPNKVAPDKPRKRVVLSFLTLSGRYPSFMRSLFAEIDTQLEEKAFEESSFSGSDNPVLTIDLDNLLTAIHNEFPKTDAHARREWRRFDKDIRRMLFMSSNAQSKQSNHSQKSLPKKSDGQPTLDRQTFELILSFCFIGDIGYDPDDHQAGMAAPLGQTQRD